MAWELYKAVGRTPAITLGEFVVKTSPNFKTPSWFEGKIYNWYLDRKTKVAKLQIEKNGLKSFGKTVTIPKVICDLIEKDENYIAFFDENAIYFCRYKDGQEHLQKFVKADKK